MMFWAVMMMIMMMIWFNTRCLRWYSGWWWCWRGYFLGLFFLRLFLLLLFLLLLALKVAFLSPSFLGIRKLFRVITFISIFITKLLFILYIWIFNSFFLIILFKFILNFLYFYSNRYIFRELRVGFILFCLGVILCNKLSQNLCLF